MLSAAKDLYGDPYPATTAVRWTATAIAIPLTISDVGISGPSITSKFKLVNFTASVTDIDPHATLTYKWTFGDGASTTTSAPSASHAYNNKTTTTVDYTAKVTATDNRGATGSASYVISVTPDIAQ